MMGKTENIWFYAQIFCCSTSLVCLFFAENIVLLKISFALLILAYIIQSFHIRMLKNAR